MKHEFARKLRRDQTDVERQLWYALRSRRFHGFKFRRQQPIGTYITDFVCFEAKLIIELDGSQHGSPDGQSADRIRTARLTRDGFRVRRFWNHELIENFDGVLEQIWLELGSPEGPLIVPIEPKLFRRPLPRGERANQTYRSGAIAYLALEREAKTGRFVNPGSKKRQKAADQSPPAVRKFLLEIS